MVLEALWNKEFQEECFQLIRLEECRYKIILKVQENGEKIKKAEVVPPLQVGAVGLAEEGVCSMMNGGRGLHSPLDPPNSVIDAPVDSLKEKNQTESGQRGIMFGSFDICCPFITVPPDFEISRDLVKAAARQVLSPWAPSWLPASRLGYLNEVVRSIGCPVRRSCRSYLNLLRTLNNSSKDKFNLIDPDID